jgi:hypothetical protein
MGAEERTRYIDQPVLKPEFVLCAIFRFDFLRPSQEPHNWILLQIMVKFAAEIMNLL